MKRAIVWTPNGCAHGPPLPKQGGRFCVSCQPGGVQVVPDHRPVGELPAAFRDLPDAYDAPQACASPHAATILIPGANETPHVKRARQQRAGS